MVNVKSLPTQIVLGGNKSSKRFSRAKKEHSAAAAAAASTADNDDSLLFATTCEDDHSCLETMSKYAYSDVGGASSVGDAADLVDMEEEEYSLFDDGSIYTRHTVQNKKNRHHSFNNSNNSQMKLEFSFSSGIQLPENDLIHNSNDDDGEDSFASPVPYREKEVQEVPKKDSTKSLATKSFDTDVSSQESSSAPSPPPKGAASTSSKTGTTATTTATSTTPRLRPSLLTANRYASSPDCTQNDTSQRKTMTKSMRSFRKSNDEASNKKDPKTSTKNMWKSIRKFVTPSSSKAAADTSSKGSVNKLNPSSSSSRGWKSFRVTSRTPMTTRTATMAEF